MRIILRMTHEDQIVIRISKTLLDRLNEIRRLEKDIPGRAEMIRRLIERAPQGAQAK